jgi:hypothetical protein
VPPPVKRPRHIIANINSLENILSGICTLVLRKNVGDEDKKFYDIDTLLIWGQAKPERDKHTGQMNL